MGETYDLFAGNAINLQVGDAILSMGKDGKIGISGTEIILQCGDSSQIKMNPSEIVLSSGTGRLTLNAAGATLTGTLVKIN